MDDENNTGLPASIAAAWGLDERPTRGPKRGLSLDQIVAAAIKIAVSDGLAAVSMHRVATDLGTSAMSLYRYVAAKDELLALMVDAAYGPPPTVAIPEEGWRARFTRWAWAYRDSLRRHPWVLRVPISGPPITPNQIAWLEYGLGALHGTGLAENEKIWVVLLLSGFIRNEATLATDLQAAILAAGSVAPKVWIDYSRLLTRLTDAEAFPALHIAIAADAFDGADHPDAEFVFGLDRVFDGIAAQIQVRSSSEAR